MKLVFDILEKAIRFANTLKREVRSAGPPGTAPGGAPLDQLIETGVRIMWVAAHPDDESFAGALLAKAGLKHRCPLYFLVLTHGDGGECCIPGRGGRDLAAIRGEEMAEVARLYGATLQHERYFNAPLPVESFPPRHEIGARWLAQGDPAKAVATAIRSFRPDVVLTLAPEFGGTGHPEHQLTARFAGAGIRLAAEPRADLAAGHVAGALDEPHRVGRLCFLLNKYWFMKTMGQGFDPRPYNEVFDVRQHCAGELTCADVMAEFTRPHQTQDRDMSLMRRVAGLIHNLYLYRADPFAEIIDPLEPALHGGMG